MTVACWRIAVAAPLHAATDMSGAGAKLSGGRWNSPGTPLLYCSSNIALATLETVHYLKSAAMPFNRYLVRIDVPDGVWKARLAIKPPAGWDAIPAGAGGRAAGDAWIDAAASAVLLVPSVIVPDEANVLINPRHPGAACISATCVRRWHFDPRLFG